MPAREDSKTFFMYLVFIKKQNHLALAGFFCLTNVTIVTIIKPHKIKRNLKMIEATTELREMGLKAVPTLVFIGMFYWFSTQIDNQFELLSVKIEATNARMESRFDLLNMKIEATNQKLDMSYSALKDQIQDLKSDVDRTEQEIMEIRKKAFK